jgi:bacterial/archaeal transporter family protein
MEYLGAIFALLAMVLWGIEEFFLKQAIDRIKPFTTLLINTIAGIIISIFAVLLFIGNPTIIGGADLLVVTVAAITALLGYIFYYDALEKQEVSLIAALDESWIIITIIIAVLFFGETLGTIHILGTLAVLLGAFFISVDFKSLRKFKFISGSGYELFSVFFIGITVVLDKIIVERIGEANAILYSLIAVLPLIFIAKVVMSKKFVLPSKKSFMIAVASGFADGLAFLFFILALSSSAVSLVSPIIASTAIVSIVLARVFLKEKMTHLQIAGAFIIIFGVAVLSYLMQI